MNLNLLSGIRYLCYHEYLNWLPDKQYLKLLYYGSFGKKLNLRNPKTYNEKLQWLKLHDRKPTYPEMVDKYTAKLYVAKQIGEKYIIPTLGIWDTFEDIDFDTLPDQFVLKCTHDSGGLVICRNKSSFDRNAAKKKIENCLNKNYYWQGREWPYFLLKPRIMAEQYMEDQNSSDHTLSDYKVLCFHGEPRLIELHRGRFTSHQTQDYYTTDWKKTNITQGHNEHYKGGSDFVPRPDTLGEMLHLSALLSKDIPHLRVDWYSAGSQLYFGELTFYDGSGFVAYDRPEDDLMLGSWIHLSSLKE